MAAFVPKLPSHLPHLSKSSLAKILPGIYGQRSSETQKKCRWHARRDVIMKLTSSGLWYHRQCHTFRRRLLQYPISIIEIEGRRKLPESDRLRKFVLWGRRRSREYANGQLNRKIACTEKCFKVNRIRSFIVLFQTFQRLALSQSFQGNPSEVNRDQSRCI